MYEEMFGKPITIGDLVQGYSENQQTGQILGLNGKLDIHPPYQREFLYTENRQKAVIQSIIKGYPINVMYWALKSDGTFECLDGQQRSISICRFINNMYSIELDKHDISMRKIFDTLDKAERDALLKYKLIVFICDGLEEEKLSWFRTINIQGLVLAEQEIRNAIYNGAWVSDAKRYFSDVNGEGYSSQGHSYNGHIYGDYVDVVGGKNSENPKSLARQRLFEIALEWAVDKYNIDNNLNGKFAMNIDSYMDMNRSKTDARELCRYYEDVMEWVRLVFPKYRDVMKRVQWGYLYNRYKNLPVQGLNEKAELLFSYADELENSKLVGVYEAVLTGDIKTIVPRAFSKVDIKRKYNQQRGICPYCKKFFDEKQMHADHIRPWSKGGKTEYSNLQMLCKECNLKKSAYDVQYKPWDKTVYEEFDLTRWDSQ